MRKFGWIFLLLGVSFSCSQAKSEEGQNTGGNNLATGSIKGVVSFKEGTKTLPDAGATVYAVSTTRLNSTKTPGNQFKNRYFQAVVDQDGSYAFPDLPADTYTLVFQSKNASRKLTYYQTRYSAVLKPLVNEMPVNSLNEKQAKEARLDHLFADQQVHVQPDIKLASGGTQIVTQEFIKH